MAVNLCLILASIFVLSHGLEPHRQLGGLVKDSLFSAPVPKEIKTNTKSEQLSNNIPRQPRSNDPTNDNDAEKNLTGRICSGDYCLDADYDKLSRPWVSDPDTGEKSPIRVGVSIDELRIQDIQDDTFSLSVQLHLGIRWIEPRISGPDKKPAEYVEGDNYLYYYDDDLDYLSDFGNTTFAALDNKFISHMWVPDIYVYNMKYGSRTLKDHDGRLFVLNGREIFYRQELIVTIWCPFRFEFWPLDRQTCSFKLGSFSHKYSEMLFALDRLTYDSGQPNPLLEYARVSALDGEDLWQEHHQETFSTTGFRVDLKRRPFQYIANYYLPAALFVAVSWASFLIPPDVIPGRMTLLITLFLVLVNIFNTVNQKAPRVEGINSMALFVIVCLLFVFLALLVYAAILLRKKRANTRLSRMRNGSFWFAYLFPFDQLTVENRNINNSNNGNSRKVSDDGNTSRNTNTSFSEEDEDDIANVSVNPAGSPTFGNFLQPPNNLPPPPPPLPSVRRASPVFTSSSSIAKRPSLATLSGLIPPPQPPQLTEDELIRPGYWHDKETDLVDKIFLFIFPMLFIAFNGLYWPFLINEGKLFNH